MFNPTNLYPEFHIVWLEVLTCSVQSGIHTENVQSGIKLLTQKIPTLELCVTRCQDTQNKVSDTLTAFFMRLKTAALQPLFVSATQE